MDKEEAPTPKNIICITSSINEITKDLLNSPIPSQNNPILNPQSIPNNSQIPQISKPIQKSIPQSLPEYPVISTGGDNIITDSSINDLQNFIKNSNFQ